MVSPTSPSYIRVIPREMMLLWHLGILGYVSVQTESKFVDDIHNADTVDKRLMSKERIIVFRPSFWKIQLELHYFNNSGRISRTLSTDCVIDFKAPVFDMCRSGDIEGLRDAFYSGSISLDVVNPLGMGLLHVSVVARPYVNNLNADSMRRVAFRATCVLGFFVRE